MKSLIIRNIHDSILNLYESILNIGEFIEEPYTGQFIEQPLIDSAIIIGELFLIGIIYLIFRRLIRVITKQLSVLPGLQSRSKFLITIQNKILYGLFLICIASCFWLLCINIFLFYQYKSLLFPALVSLKLIFTLFQQDLGTRVVQSAIILGVVAVMQKPLIYVLGWMRQRVQSWQIAKINDLELAPILDLFQKLKSILVNGTWLFAFFLCSQLFKLKNISGILMDLLKIYFIVAAGILLVQATKIVLNNLDQLSERYLREHETLQAYGQLRTLIPFLHRCAEYVIYIGTVTIVISQIEPLMSLAAIGTRAIKILSIILSIRILTVVSTIFLTEFLIRTKTLTEEQHKRRMTLIPILQSTLKYAFFFWAGVLILKVVEIDPAPILAAAGIVGLAVGLGAQNLINDTVSGCFILLENYFLVGDYIVISDLEGLVEAIELRTTRVRHPNGQLQIIRNGDINSIVNYSRDYIYAVVDVGVAYDVNLNQVYQVLESVGATLNDMFPDDILEPLEVDGVEEFGQTRIIVRVVAKLKPNDSRRGVHDDVQGDLRKLLKEAFDQEGITMPAIQAIGLLD